MRKRNPFNKNKTREATNCQKDEESEEVLNCLEDKIPCFLEPVFIKRKQSTFFDERITQLKADECIFRVDFAFNSTCQYQDEIQAAHCS